MYDTAILQAWDTDRLAPDWAPLEKFLPLDLCGLFMFMGASQLDDGTGLRHYKHGDTRAYLHIDVNGDSWEDLGRGRFRRMRHDEAIEFVFDSSWVLWRATEEERTTLKAALEAARERGNGDQAAGAHILPCSPASGFRQLPDARWAEDEDEVAAD